MTTRHGTVTRDGASGTIAFERRLAHPVEAVWDAITTPSGLAAWWLPFPAQITVDLRVGGLISFDAPEFGEAPMTCEVLEVDAPHRLVHTHFDRAITVTWSLSAEGDGCVLRLTQDTPDIAAALAQGHIAGLHHSLDRLAPALAGTPDPWHWDLLAELGQQYVVERYVDGFRAGDHAAIHACLTDDVSWDIVGHASAAGRAEFEALIDGPPGASLPRLTLDRHVSGPDEVVTFGAGEFEDPSGTTQRFRFVDSFAFRGELVCGVVSYVVPLPGVTSPRSNA